MITTILICAAAVLAVFVLLLVARGEAKAINSAEELLAALQPIDLQSLRNLTDPKEEAYLRRELNSADFRRVQRTRLRAAAEYVGRTAHNAAVLMRLSHAARQNQRPEVVLAAQELADAALSLRINSLLALGLLHVRQLCPHCELRLSRTLDSYMRARTGTLRLSRLRMPTMVSRIEAAL